MTRNAPRLETTTLGASVPGTCNHLTFAGGRREGFYSMAQTHNRSDLLKNAGVVTTLIDAAMEFTKGRRASGLLLLGAAALSSRIPGFGTAVSFLLRAYRRLR